MPSFTLPFPLSRATPRGASPKWRAISGNPMKQCALPPPGTGSGDPWGMSGKGKVTPNRVNPVNPVQKAPLHRAAGKGKRENRQDEQDGQDRGTGARPGIHSLGCPLGGQPGFRQSNAASRQRSRGGTITTEEIEGAEFISRLRAFPWFSRRLPDRSVQGKNSGNLRREADH